MADRTITSADSSYFLGSADYALGVELEGYAADAAFALDNADTSETTLGVDGHLAAGWVPRSYNQTITLQADSPSATVIDAFIAAQDVARTIFRLTGTITLPGNKMSYSLRRGVIKNYTAMPTAQRVLQPRTYVIEWEKVVPVPVG